MFEVGDYVTVPKLQRVFEIEQKMFINGSYSYVLRRLDRDDDVKLQISENFVSHVQIGELPEDCNQPEIDPQAYDCFMGWNDNDRV